MGGSGRRAVDQRSRAVISHGIRDTDTRRCDAKLVLHFRDLIVDRAAARPALRVFWRCYFSLLDFEMSLGTPRLCNLCCFPVQAGERIRSGTYALF